MILAPVLAGDAAGGGPVPLSSRDLRTVTLRMGRPALCCQRLSEGRLKRRSMYDWMPIRTYSSVGRARGLSTSGPRFKSWLVPPKARKARGLDLDQEVFLSTATTAGGLQLSHPLLRPAPLTQG